MQNTVEVDIKYEPGNFTQEQYFILNKDITVCSCNPAGWTNQTEYETEETDRQLLKHIIQCFKEGTSFKEFGKVEFIKIWNLSNFKNLKRF